jgi:hypothetical protein
LLPPDPETLSAVQLPAGLVELVERLGDTVYTSREAATAKLLAGVFDNEQLYAILVQLQLSAEQRHRLLSIIRDRLINTPRGAVGIKVDRRWLPDQIVIEELLPDLPAQEVLEVGDRIMHLEGQRLESWDAFVEAVQTRPPGSKISVTVERVVAGRRPPRVQVQAVAPDVRYETLQIELALGSADRLLDPRTGRPQGGGPVALRRQREADQALSRFSGEPKVIKVDE